MSIQAEYKRRRAEAGKDGHWFDESTMRFFGSRIGATHVVGDYETGLWVFVTSEQPPYGPRGYTVHRMTPDGSISDIGPFCQWTRSVANRVARDLAEKGTAVVDGHTYTLEDE